MSQPSARPSRRLGRRVGAIPLFLAASLGAIAAATALEEAEIAPLVAQILATAERLPAPTLIGAPAPWPDHAKPLPSVAATSLGSGAAPTPADRCADSAPLAIGEPCSGEQTLYAGRVRPDASPLLVRRCDAGQRWTALAGCTTESGAWQLGPHDYVLAPGQILTLSWIDREAADPDTPLAALACGALGEGWRLPSRGELAYLYAQGLLNQTDAPEAPPLGGPEGGLFGRVHVQDAHWSATRHDADRARAWALSRGGEAMALPLDHGLRVRCVRDGGP